VGVHYLSSASLWLQAQEKAVFVSFMRKRNLRNHTTRGRLGFLYESYNPKIWYYEVVELFRKVSFLIFLFVRGVALICWGMCPCTLDEVNAPTPVALCYTHAVGAEWRDAFRPLLFPVGAAGVRFSGVLLLPCPPLPAPLPPAWGHGCGGGGHGYIEPHSAVRAFAGQRGPLSTHQA
jgi:hypothetical protein